MSITIFISMNGVRSSSTMDNIHHYAIGTCQVCVLQLLGCTYSNNHWNGGKTCAIALIPKAIILSAIVIAKTTDHINAKICIIICRTRDQEYYVIGLTSASIMEFNNLQQNFSFLLSFL